MSHVLCQLVRPSGGAHGSNRGPSDAPGETSTDSEAPKEEAVGVIFETQRSEPYSLTEG